MLTSSHAISEPAKENVFKLNLSDNNEEIESICCRADIDSVWDPLTC